MSRIKLGTLVLITLLTICGFSHGVSAHEVYVLSPGEINTALTTPSPSFLKVLDSNLLLFSFWAFIGALAIASIFFLSISRFLEKRLDPTLTKIKHWGHVICRVTIGLSLLASAYYQASYGPEFPFASSFGVYAPLITSLLLILGILILFDFYTRLASLVALVLYLYACVAHGWYMLTYVNYLGEILALIIIGTNRTYLGSFKKIGTKFFAKFAPYSMAVVRVLFGVALIYTSFYAKVLHSNLALETVMKYHLTNYLHFEPHFLVLGAACVEILLGLFFVLGIEIRFTALFMLFWLTQSLCFFGEAVWPHIILIGIPIAFFFYGYDKYSIEGYFFKKGKREPVL